MKRKSQIPVYLKDISDFEKLEQFESVLIIPCRFCPAASLAVIKNEPYFRFFRVILQTAAYERYIKAMKIKLEKRGVKTDVFRNRRPHQFFVCMWTSKRRKKLMKQAKNYDALVVLGCEAAVQTILDSCDVESLQVVRGMKNEGIMSILPRFHLPERITLQLNSITPLLYRERGAESWMRL